MVAMTRASFLISYLKGGGGPLRVEAREGCRAQADRILPFTRKRLARLGPSRQGLADERPEERQVAEQEEVQGKYGGAA